MGQTLWPYLGNFTVEVFTDCQCTFVGQYIEGLLGTLWVPFCPSVATVLLHRGLEGFCLYKDTYSSLVYYYILREAREKKDVFLHILFFKAENLCLDICMSYYMFSSR